MSSNENELTGNINSTQELTGTLSVASNVLKGTLTEEENVEFSMLPSGKDATVNGYNAVEITGGTNIEIIQDGEQITIQQKELPKVDDIKVNGNSVVSNKIAEIDLSGYVEKEGYIEFSQEEKEKLASLENYDDTNLKALIGTKLSEESDPIFNTSPAKKITNTDISNWNNKSDFNGDYNSLKNKPEIPQPNNGVLSFLRNGDFIGRFYADSADNVTININVPTATDDLTNNSGFITKAVDNLVNYYEKSETYTQQQIKDLITSLNKVNYQILQTKPSVGETGVIYFIPNKDTQETNVYDEYMYINGKWEIIGNTSINLDGVATEEWVESRGYLTEHQDISGKQDIIDDLDTIRSGAEKGATALQSFTESDPIFLSSVAATITQDDIDSWDGKSNFNGDYNSLENTPSIPKAYSELSNDLNYQTLDEINTLISNAIAGVTQIDYEIVTELPETGEKGVIYLISNSGTSTNIYDEYLYINNGFEKIGTTEIDLSGYVTKNGNGQTITGTVTFTAEVTFSRSGSSDICSGIVCAFKVNRAQITSLITQNIYTGKGLDGITFYTFTTASSMAPGDPTQIGKIDSSGNFYEGSTKLSDKYQSKSTLDTDVKAIITSEYLQSLFPNAEEVEL